MRLQLGFVAFCAAVSVGGDGVACSRVEYPRAWASGQVDVAAHLISKAANVEVVVAESAHVLGGKYPDLLDEAWKSIHVVDGRTEPADITFRVVERLKGAGPTKFVLRGAVLTLAAGSKTVGPKFYPEYETFRSLDEPNDCRMVVPAVIGASYLVFRGADGRLLEATVPVGKRGVGELVGPAYEALSGENDPWLRRVRISAGLSVAKR